jgi:HD-GYP domain-containing protein (c-di-GMP phosphodiesterase class II)
MNNKKYYINYNDRSSNLKSNKKSFINQRTSILEDLKISSKWTFDHSQRVAWLCNILARNFFLMNKNYKSIEKYSIKIATEAGLFHDLGKKCIEKDALDSNINLREEEKKIKNIQNKEELKIINDNIIKGEINRDKMEEHPKFTKKILEQYSYPYDYKCNNCKNDFPTICGDHHEKLHGKGYPNKKKKICIITQIVSICDIYDALRSSRPYKPSKSHIETIKIMNLMAENGGLNKDLIKILNDSYIPELWIYNFEKKLSLPYYT